MKFEDRLMLIFTPDFCDAAVERQGEIVNAAPMLKYMIGWDVGRVFSYCRKKGWECRRYDKSI